jgi:4-alpha-glucanotransferase
MPLHPRRAGILLHPTSLPGRFGIGDLGPACIDFLNWAHDTGLAYWQILPLGPTGFGDSPYQCFSAFAGNPLLISPELLELEGLIDRSELDNWPVHHGPVDYGWIMDHKHEVLHKAHQKFKSLPQSDIHQRYDAWANRESVKGWLEDYALFKALKKENHNKCWIDWPENERRRKPEALTAAAERLKEDVRYQEFIQFLFFDQWERIRREAAARHIYIIGDAPIYVSFDSADTWANQSQFELDPDGHPTAVAGVPPDYFSETGQLWGNPLYKWPSMATNRYSWWVARLRAIFETVDIVRLDHFRGFMGYYAVPFGHDTAENGEWRKGPGDDFFKAMKEAIGNLPIIAEDLGEITEDVTLVRRQFNLPGMVILQFAWAPAQLNPMIADPNNGFLPHRHEYNSVVYTGTHDNDTSIGWWHNSSTPEERTAMQIYLSVDGNLANWDLIRCGMRSVANTFIIPAQDLLNLGTEARMNLPGRPAGNWTWRLNDGDLSSELQLKVRDLLLIYERCSNPPEAAVPAPPKVPGY